MSVYNKKEEKYTNASAAANNAQVSVNNSVVSTTNNSGLIAGLSQGLNATATTIIVAIVLVLLLGLAISITVTVFGHKARVKCVGNSKFGFYSPLIITFLILMWLGNLVPLYGIVVTLVGLVGAITMIVLSNKNCVKGK